MITGLFTWRSSVKWQAYDTLFPSYSVLCLPFGYRIVHSQHTFEGGVQDIFFCFGMYCTQPLPQLELRQTCCLCLDVIFRTFGF